MQFILIMNKEQTFFNLYNISILLLCLANVLELFIPRMDEGNYFIRMPIQLINGALLILMWVVLIHWKVKWTPTTKSVFLFIPLVLLYATIYIIYNQIEISKFSGYIKFLLWTTSIIFFYEMMLKYGLNKNVLCIYIITFIAGIGKKILEGSKFESETLGAGDTASLPLLFILPLVLICFNNKYKIVVLSVISILVLFSVRRTTILGFTLCLPFVFNYISTKLRFYHLILIGLIFTILIVYTWEYVGEAVLYRFENLLVGDKGGTEDSFGSGRSEFYLTTWNNWVGNSLFSLLFGYGLTSTNELLMRVHNVQHAHNDFLELGHTFGLLGLGIWFLFIIQLLKLKSLIKHYCPECISLYYICIISYIIIAMASGCIERITTLSFALTVSMLLYKVQVGMKLSDANKAEQVSKKASTLRAAVLNN